MDPLDLLVLRERWVLRANPAKKVTKVSLVWLEFPAAMACAVLRACVDLQDHVVLNVS